MRSCLTHGCWPSRSRVWARAGAAPRSTSSPACPNGARSPQELGGDKVKVYIATNALQDPHHVEAKPSLIARARSADLVVATGAELEIGWLPLVTAAGGQSEGAAGQARLLRGGRRSSRMLDKPTRLDRAEGDVHAARQSAHPDRSAQHRARRRAARGAPGRARSGERRVLPGALQGVRRALECGDRALGDAGGAAEGRRRSSSSTRPSPISIDWLGLKEVAALEPKPGVEPTTAHLRRGAGDAATARRRRWCCAPRTRAIAPSQWIAERAKINAVMLPFTVGGDDSAKDLFGLFDDTIARLLKGAQ